MAKEPAEQLLDEMTMGTLRGISDGILPNYEISPSSPLTQWMQTALSALLPRKKYNIPDEIWIIFINAITLTTYRRSRTTLSTGGMQ